MESESLLIGAQDESATECQKVITKAHLIYTVEEGPEDIIKSIELSLVKYCHIANTPDGVSEITCEYSVRAG